jgi:hypothetical protein
MEKNLKNDAREQIERRSDWPMFCSLFPFFFVHVHFCSEGISDVRFLIRMTNEAEGMRFIMEVRMRKITQWEFLQNLDCVS